MTTPVESLAGLTVGTVEAVSGDEVKVVLEFDAPQATSLNTGQPSRFPRINGFVLIPNESGALVGLVTWLGVERASYPKRTGLGDFGLVDLPFPLRKMALTPIATLRPGPGEVGAYDLERGVAVLPSVGDPVVLPTSRQLRAIVESQGSNRRVAIGTATLAADAVVAVDPDRIFGRHLAVLGNTGSGKSCSVAGLVRWSLLAAKAAIEAGGRDGTVNARFIVLDPNGEYLTTFADLGADVRVFRPTLGSDDESAAQPLTVPAWMWNSHEWAAFTQASPGVQRPILQRGLRGMRGGRGATTDEDLALARVMRGYRTWLDQLLVAGPSWHGGDFRGRQDTGAFLRSIESEIASLVPRFAEFADRLRAVGLRAAALAENKETRATGGIRYQAFTEAELLEVKEPLDDLIGQLPEIAPTGVASEDAPVPFEIDDLPAYLELLAKSPDFAQGAQHVPMLVTRIRTLLTDPRLAPIVNPPDRQPLDAWLEDHLGADRASNGQIAVVDLSLVPSDVLHLTIAVIARVVFEACQRYRKLTGQELPTTLILEEAHTFIRQASAADGDATNVTLCRETFEKIAREGRKFGLGLVLSSQRPSELSATVLAQCNTFLLHRIVNDRDQDLVGRLVPDNLGGLLRELPSLPSRQAILLGWATPVPVLVEISELTREQQPRSNDPRFWNVWTGSEDRPIDWTAVAEDWTGIPNR
jgi:DNA helicase HerA-like ATPase